MPEYARVCQSMPEYASVCQSMIEYTIVCHSIPEYAEKNGARDALAERMKRLRAKQASQQTVDAVVDQHDEAFRY